MTDRTLRISARLAEEIRQWASDELCQWPRDTAYAADLESLLAQLTAQPPDPAALDRLIAERVREAVEAERESCAQEADLLADTWDADTKYTANTIADRIRARGSKEGQS